jgi:hypothetical protein
VIGMGVFLGQSTRIYNRATGEVSYGRVPPAAWSCRGSLPAADGSHSALLRGDRQAGRREDARQDQRSTNCCAGWQSERQAVRPEELRYLQEGAQLAASASTSNTASSITASERIARTLLAWKDAGRWLGRIDQQVLHHLAHAGAEPQDAGFSDAEWKLLLKEYPQLLKRPIVVTDRWRDDPGIQRQRLQEAVRFGLGK